MNEDETFRRLKRIPFDEVVNDLSLNVPDEWKLKRAALLVGDGYSMNWEHPYWIASGWTRKAFMKEMKQRIKRNNE